MKAVLLLALLLGVVFAQKKSFSATIQITDPTIPGGTLNGKMFYNPNLPAPSAGKQRIDFALGVQEFFEFSADPNTPSLRFLVCPGQCQTETVKIPLFIYFGEGADTLGAAQTVNGRTCTLHTKAGNNANTVKSLFLDANGFPCRATFGNGKVIDFLTVDGSYTADPSASPAPALNRAGCPAPSCNKKMDIDLVFDESGSIDAPSFAAEVKFAKDFANSFTFGVNAVQMGLEQFSTNSRHTINLTPIKQNFLNSMNSVTQRGGTTCLTCGCEAARAELFSARARAGVVKLMIILTDGQGNVRVSETKGCFDALKASGVTVASIGVGPEFNPTEVSALASNTNLFFSSPSFSALSSILNSLVQATCDDLPASLCPATCKGFCSCGGVCLCPDQCNPADNCKVSTCPNANTGCVDSAKVCKNGDPCLTDGCNPATGCTTTAVTCNDNTVCTTDTCQTGVGCKFTPINCDDNNKCTTDSCDPIQGCKHATVNCNDNNACTADSCNPATGCVNTAINCNDNNACTADSCNPATGCVNTAITCNDNDPCTDDSCVIASGCKFTPKVCTPALFCQIPSCSNGICQFDNGSCNACINVTCTPQDNCHTVTCVDNNPQHLPGTGTCVQAAKVCNDNNKCTTDACDLGTGNCVFTPVVCTKNPCETVQCNLATGNCDRTPIVCNDNNKCTTDACNPANDQCVFTPVPCTKNPCATVQCDLNTGNCVNTAIVCNDNNKCTTDTCNPANDQCVFTPVVCTKNPCETVQCSLATGQCDRTPIVCNDNNKCTVDTCNPANDQCVFTPVVCNHINCKDNQCDPTSGQCIAPDRNCTSGNACIIDGCDVNTDQCTQVAVVCDDKNACTIDTCDIKTGCVFTPVPGDFCDDKNACTADTCDTIKGCEHKKIDCARNQTDACLSNNCDPVTGCVYNPIDCSQIVDKFKQGDCQLAVCKAKVGCVLEPIPGATIDPCGFCITNGTAAPFCFLGLGLGAVAGIAGGVIAAIVIAVIAAVVIAAVSGAAGYAIYKRGVGSMGGAAINPLWKSPDTQGVNALYKA